MKLVFGASYSENFNSIMPRRACERVIANPELEDRFTSDDDAQSIVTRTGRQDHWDWGPYIAVVTSVDRGETANVVSAFRVPAGFYDQLKSPTPSLVLESLADQCGIEMQFEGKPTKFIDSATVVTERRSVEALFDLLHLPKNEGQPWIAGGTFKGVPHGPRGSQVDMRNFFAIDRIAYLKWLQGYKATKS